MQQNYGLGRVLYIGIDSTWRWRKGVGDLYHHRFWGQVTRWAADRPLEIGNDFLHFGAAEPVYRSGQDVELFVRFNDTKDAARAASGGPGAGAAPRRRRQARGRRAADPQAGGAERLRGPCAEPAGRRLPNPAEDGCGARRAAADVFARQPKETGPLQASFSVTAPESAEMSDLSMDRASLNELANDERR